MNRHLWIAGLAIALVAADAKDDAKKAADAAQGTWNVVGMESEGNKMPEEQVKQLGLKLIIKGDTFSYEAMGQKVMEGTYKIDATKKPMHLDSKGKNPQGVEEEVLGIVEVEGDTMRVCMKMDKKRPSTFKTEAGSGAMTFTYKKAK